MNLEERIKAGVDGKFDGLDNGFDRLNDYLFGIQRGCYTLLGGMSGVYKTTLTDYMILNALRDAEARGLELNIIYYSFEIDELTKKCNWLSNIIYDKYNVSISPEKIKGFGKNRLNSEELKLVESEISYVDRLFSKINFRFRSNNPTGIYKELLEFAKSRGTFNYTNYKDENGIDREKMESYVPNNPLAYNLVVMDHLFLLHKERGWEAKETIDKMSEFFVILRNLCGYSFLALQQFNQGLNSVDRQKFKGIDLSPSQNDFRDSTSPYADADVVLGLMSPFKMDMSSSLGYNISKLREKMVMLKIIKNRLSKDNIAIGLYCNPKAMSFSELPKPEDIDYSNYE